MSVNAVTRVSDELYAEIKAWLADRMTIVRWTGLILKARLARSAARVPKDMRVDYVRAHYDGNCKRIVASISTEESRELDRRVSRERAGFQAQLIRWYMREAFFARFLPEDPVAARPKTCVILGCQHAHYAKGYCKAHRRQFAKAEVQANG